MRNVIVAFPKEEANQKFKRLLMQYGYHVPCICSSGNHVLNRAIEFQYGIVLTGYRMKDMAWDELLKNLPQGFRMVVMIPEARRDDISPDIREMSCITIPFVVRDLLDALEKNAELVDAIRRRDKNSPKKRSPQEAEAIQKAKDLLIQKREMTEAAAHRYLQRRSMESRISLAECAKKVIQMLE